MNFLGVLSLYPNIKRTVTVFNIEIEGVNRDLLKKI